MDELRFDTLPSLTGRLAAQVPRVDRRFADAAAGQLLGGRPASADRPLHLLGPVTWSWRFYLSKESKKGFFLRFRRRRPAKEEVVVDADLRLRLKPVPESQPAVRLSDVSFEMTAPPFLVLSPGAETLQRFAPLLGGVSPDDTILLRVGDGDDDVLAAWFPPGKKRSAKARLWYRGRVVRDAGGGWPLEPFVALMETIHTWVAGSEQGPAVPFQPFSDRENDADTILLRFVQAYCRATKALATNRPPPAETFGRAELGRRLATPFAVTAFETIAALRLDAAGNLARDGEKDRFLLRMEVRVERDERTGVKARISVLPPDFLVSGALRESFLEVLEKDADKLGGLLRLGLEPFRRFLEEARPRASVLRVRRKSRDRDVNLLLLRATLDGRPRLVLLRAPFRVRAAADPPVVHRTGSYKLLYDGSGAGALDKDIAYFKHLIGALKDWMEAVD